MFMNIHRHFLRLSFSSICFYRVSTSLVAWRKISFPGFSDRTLTYEYLYKYVLQ